ncbi:MAG TPA: hypothetical protein DD433_11255 [Ruminococcaceae bacterium]|nr:hypothetical protein [Oscillospiraceae bacterium]
MQPQFYLENPSIFNLQTRPKRNIIFFRRFVQLFEKLLRETDGSRDIAFENGLIILNMKAQPFLILKL